MTALRRISLFGVSIAAIGLALVATAWACTGTGSLNPDELPNGTYPASGVAGRTVTVTGKGYEANKAVEIRWDDEPVPLLTAMPTNGNPQFAVAVTIPADAPVGVHYLVATQPGNTKVEPGRMAFEVVPAPQAASGGATDSAPAPRVVSGSTSGAGLSGSAQTAPAAAPPAAVANPAPVTDEEAQAPAAAGAPTPAAAPVGLPTRSVPPVAAVPASGNPASVATPPGGAVFGGSLPAPAAAAASRRSVTGDLYSGFSADRTARAAGLTDAPASSGPVGQAVVGMALLVSGLLALSGGFLVAELRRRSLAVAAVR